MFAQELTETMVGLEYKNGSKEGTDSIASELNDLGF